MIKVPTRKAFATIITSFLAALLFAGCAPGVHMQVQRTPNWNTAGVKRVAVMPFEHGRGRGQREAADYLTIDAVTILARTNHFTMVSSDEVSRLRERGERVENHVDALLTGKILSVDSKDSSYIGRRYDPDIKESIEAVVYTREVTLSISYSLELTRDGSLVGIANRTASARDERFVSSELASAAQLLRKCHVLDKLVRDLVPYTEYETRVLMNEKTKDKALKEKMKHAHAHVNSGNYKFALESYLKIYDEYRVFAAIYNAAVMHEALGNLAKAIELMRLALDDTGNPKASSEIVRLNKRVKEQEVVETDYKGKSVRLMDKTIEYAAGEARKVLPQNAKVWFVVNEGNERDLANAAADAMVETFISNGITVVDRKDVKLIEQELVMQMSGIVDDADLVRAGYLAGANTIVTIAISGTGSMRRLQLKVLDVETGVPLLQSGTGDQWNL